MYQAFIITNTATRFSDQMEQVDLALPHHIFILFIHHHWNIIFKAGYLGAVNLCLICPFCKPTKGTSIYLFQNNESAENQ